MSKSALASLTAQYTDSENEDDHQEDDSLDSQNSQSSQVIIPQQATPKPSPDPKSFAAPTNRKKKRSRKSWRRLVSYNDDTVISDEEQGDDVSMSESSDESESEDANKRKAHTSATNDLSSKKDKNTIPMDTNQGISDHLPKESDNSSKLDKSQKYKHYGFPLPPEPKGKSGTELVEKIRHLYEKMESSNMDMNRIIQQRKEFRNPSIYEKLIQFCDINEFGTNYPPEIYDPLKWGAESYYEELARVQKNDMLKRQKERKDTDKIEQATALARKVEEEAKKRKSKWDQPAAPVVQAVPALTTTVTGTKGTVISAFGTLPKKPAP